MGSEQVTFILLPLAFFLALAFIFSESLSVTAETYIGGITCPLPEYTMNYTNSCSNVTHATAYSDDEFVLWDFDLLSTHWHAAIPNGWIAYVGDAIAVISEKIVALFALLVLPFSVPASVSGLSWLWVIEVPLFIMLGLGLVKVFW